MSAARYTPAQLRAAAHAIIDSSDALAGLGFELQGVTTGPEPEGLVIMGVDASQPDVNDEKPLPTELESAVREHVAALNGIRGTFAVADIRVKPGRVDDLL